MFICSHLSVFLVQFHREIKKIPDPVELGFKIAGKYFLELASKWVDFVVNRCEKGKGRRPRYLRVHQGVSIKLLFYFATKFFLDYYKEVTVGQCSL